MPATTLINIGEVFYSEGFVVALAHVFECRATTKIVGIDAVDYRVGGRELQFKKRHIERELKKAYVGFLSDDSELDDKSNGRLAAVSSGMSDASDELQHILTMIHRNVGLWCFQRRSYSQGFYTIDGLFRSKQRLCLPRVPIRSGKRLVYVNLDIANQTHPKPQKTKSQLEAVLSCLAKKQINTVGALYQLLMQYEQYFTTTVINRSLDLPSRKTFYEYVTTEL